MQRLLSNGSSKIFGQKIDFLNYTFDISFIPGCNSISQIPFNSLQSHLLFDVLCFKIDQVVMKLSATPLT